MQQTNLERATGNSTSMLGSKTDFSSLKTKLENLDVDELKNFPTGLSKLSNVVDNNVVKKNCV